jgi:hypothetical protein
LSSLLTFSFFVFFPKCFGDLNVLLLTFLRTSAKQNNDSITIATKINAVSRPEIDTTFQDASANAFDILKIALFHPNYGGYHSGCSRCIQMIEPLSVRASVIGIDIFLYNDHLQ